MLFSRVSPDMQGLNSAYVCRVSKTNNYENNETKFTCNGDECIHPDWL